MSHPGAKAPAKAPAKRAKAPAPRANKQVERLKQFRQDKADEAVVLDDTTALEDDLADMEREIRNAKETLWAPASFDRDAVAATPSTRPRESPRVS